MQMVGGGWRSKERFAKWAFKRTLDRKGRSREERSWSVGRFGASVQSTGKSGCELGGPCERDHRFPLDPLEGGGNT